MEFLLQYSLVVMDSVMSMIIGLKFTLNFCVQNVTKEDRSEAESIPHNHRLGSLNQSLNDLLALFKD